MTCRTAVQHWLPLESQLRKWRRTQRAQLCCMLGTWDLPASRTVYWTLQTSTRHTRTQLDTGLQVRTLTRTALHQWLDLALQQCTWCLAPAHCTASSSRRQLQAGTSTARTLCQRLYPQPTSHHTAHMPSNCLRRACLLGFAPSNRPPGTLLRKSGAYCSIPCAHLRTAAMVPRKCTLLKL